MKFLYLGASLVVSFGLSLNAIAHEAEHICYMTTNSGQVIDLSKSVCQRNLSNQAGAKTGSGDQAFLTDYKQIVMNYPDARETLLASVERSPESSISQAKSVCNDLEAGLSIEDIRHSHTEGTSNKVDALNVSLITSLAPKYYCPQYRNP